MRSQAATSRALYILLLYVRYPERHGHPRPQRLYCPMPALRALLASPLSRRRQVERHPLDVRLSLGWRLNTRPRRSGQAEDDSLLLLLRNANCIVSMSPLDPPESQMESISAENDNASVLLSSFQLPASTIHWDCMNWPAWLLLSTGDRTL
ncbi:hypothetical protein EDB81DRAFT_57193 [Dactylonectria macrodidyma]|uniref:Uncharacterized protein n=1 Tax=Dactylonectria macrodidyma TaxID=307937 RepID=A0A9P9J452_9HYPO|nr:hypothetical protein EDB81DRAFT_57193 [Dactylonectria macrodidyma]